MWRFFGFRVSVDPFFDAPRLGFRAERLTDREELSLGAGGFAYVQGAAIGMLKHGGYPDFAGKPLSGKSSR